MKIQGTEVTHEHVGRGVVYLPEYGPREDGVITSFNDKYVFVRYANSVNGIATHPSRLEWLSK